MDASEQAAEQLVRITLAGSEVALRLSGAGAKNIAAALMAAASSTEQTKGKTRLASLLKSGKELKVFQIPDDQLRSFAAEAKRYGVLYVIVRQDDGNVAKPVDLMVKAEDASKLNRIIDKLEIGKVDAGEVDSVVSAIEKDRAQADNKPAEIGAQGKDAADRLIDQILAKPTRAEPERSHDPLGQTRKDATRSEPISGTSSRSGKAITDMGRTQNPKRESVRKQMRDIENRRIREAKSRPLDLNRQQNTHEQPAKTKKKLTPEKGL